MATLTPRPVSIRREGNLRGRETATRSMVVYVVDVITRKLSLDLITTAEQQVHLPPLVLPSVA